MDEDLLADLILRNKTKIVLLILDGLGGLPLEPGGKTELEAADTPNLDQLASRSALGLTVPVAPGVTSGSGPGHLAIFGYDPIEYQIGRGAMEALGVDFDLGMNDLAARGNFCTVDEQGTLVDRRAGRLPSDKSSQLITELNSIRVGEVEFAARMVKEHRFALVMRGENLNDGLSETDPLKNGCQPLPVTALREDSQYSANLINEYIIQARGLLHEKQPANMILLRGFARLPKIPGFQERYGLNAAAIAVNGMYRGVARMVGMSILPVPGETPLDEITTLEQHWDQYDFFYIHIKKTDTAGEDGDYWRKVRAIEEIDALIPRITALHPDVLIVGGDHSSPAVLKSHSWHPVPLMMYSDYVREDRIPEFGERACLRGSLGILPAKLVMPLALANAGRLAKYGA